MADRPQTDPRPWEAEMFRLLVENVKDYAIFIIDSEGRVQTWSAGAQRLLGYQEKEIIGQSVDQFFTPEDVARGAPQEEMQKALQTGRGEDDRWHIRKDGSRLWSNGVMTPLRDEQGRLRGFAKIMRDRTEIKLAEEEAHQRNREADQRRRLYEAALSNTPDLVYVFDLEHRFLYANEGLLKMWGRTWDDAIGKNCLELGYPAWHAAMHDREIEQVVATKQPIKGEVPFTGTFGRRIYEYIFVPVLDENGTVEAVAGTARDVTERKRTEEAVRENEARFRGLMEQAPFSIQILSPNGKTLQVNRAWEELWGVKLEQIGDYNLLHDPQLEARGVLPLIRRAFAGETVHVPAIEYDPNETIPDITQEGDHRRWTSAVIYPLKDATGLVREVILIHEDVTARKRAEQERERFAFLVENSHDFIGICDLDFEPLFVNREGLALVGLESLEQARRTPVPEFFFPEDQAFITEQFFPQVLREGHGEIEIRFRHFRTGQPIWMAYAVFIMRDTTGIPYGWATISRNVTERRRTEQALKEADRLKDEFLAMLAHELRNPLAPIRNALHITKQPGVDVATLQQVRDMMERQVQHMARLLDDLLDVSRISRGKIELRKEVLDVAAVVHRSVEAVRPFLESQHHLLTLALPPEALRVEADPTRLEQVLTNLLNNAAKYTDPGGHIWLTVERENAEAVLRVRDTGIGIAPEMLPLIFDLFVQVERRLDRSQGGIGIGLTLVQRLVQLHGGTITAHSDGPGRGSEFVVRLPALPAEDAGTHAAESSLSTSTPLPRQRVLVVDDSHDAGDSLGLLLQLAGQDVQVVRDGPAALEMASAFRPQIVLLDIGMPGMDGYEVCRRLRQQPGMANALMIALTGWGQDEDRRRSRDAGFDMHFVKPVEPAALYKLLAQPRKFRS